MTKNIFGFAAVVLFLTITTAGIGWKNAAAGIQDKIEYNTVYDCGAGKRKFRVPSCNGTGKFDRCEIFYINENSPGGGFKDTIYRSQIDDMLNQGCKTKNGPAVNSGQVAKVERETSDDDKTPVKEKAAGSAACFASDSESSVKNENEKSFRGVLRNFWEKKPEESGPKVTLTFQKMTVGAPRRWRPTFDDAYSQADPKKLIFPVRATFTTCTDYTDAITTRKMERIYDCYVHKTGGWQCSQTGASGALALKDEKEYIQKQRQ